MLTQCSVFESGLKSLKESHLKVLGGNQTSYPGALFKTIYFQKAIDESGIQNLLDLLQANTEAIMATLIWFPGRGAYFFWDFDINPVLDINHPMNGLHYQGDPGGATDASGYNSNFAVANSDPGFLFDQTGFLLQGGWHIETVGVIKYIAFATWVLYEGPAKMLHSYDEFIGDPSLLQPPVPLDGVPPPVLSGQAGFGGTTIPVVVLDPIPFSRPYKMPLPDYKENYFNENNIFRTKDP